MRIRRAEPGDEAALARQMKAVADEGRWLATQSDRPLEDLQAMFKAGIEAGHLIFVAEDRGQVVGEIGIHPAEPEGVFSLGMFVLPDSRGRGLGRKLLDAALEAARAEGCRKVELEVFPDNAPALNLYLNRGFEIEGLRRGHYLRLDGSLRSTLLMARIL